MVGPNATDILNMSTDQRICFRITGSTEISARERAAVGRVCRAGVKAPESAVLAWVRAVGPESVLMAKLGDIRAVAAAF
jgi:hypothetical protein